MKKIFGIIFILILLFAFNVNSQENSVSGDAVEEKPLAEISLDEVGLISIKEGGFAPDMWKESDGAFVSILLDKLPQTKSPVISGIKKKLLISIAAKPEKLQDADALFFVRMKHLANMGDSASIANILRKVPDNFRNERTDSIYAISLFSAQNYVEGCKIAQTAMQKYNNIFWRKIILACQADSGRNGELDLAMKLLKEDGKKLSDDFIKIISGLQKKDAEKILARQDFVKSITGEVLPEKQIQQPFPRIRTHFLNMPDEYLNIWMSSMNSIGDSAKRIESMERFYALLESLGEKITAKEWQEMAMYSLANNIKIPSFVWTSLLQEAVTNKRQGEITLIVIHMAAESELEKLSPELLRWMIYAMDEIKFKKDAQKIVIEAMGVK